MQEISTREKLFALLGFIILLVALPLSLLVVRQRVTYRGRASLVVSVPKQVRVTNVHSRGFTVSWLTDNQTSGSVLNGSTETQDTRVDSYTHYVDVLNLNPLTPYTIKIKSGPDTYGYTTLNGGTWEKSLSGGLTVTTAKEIGNETNPTASDPPGAYSTEAGAFGPCPDGTLKADGTPNMNAACFRPYPLWGEVKNASGQAAEGALIYAAIKEAPDSKFAISTISGSDGKWSLELANQYTNDFQSYLAYNPLADKINVTAYSNQGSATSTNLPMHSVVIADASMNDPSPVMLTIESTAPVVTPNPTPVVTSPPGGGIRFTINKAQLQGRADHSMTYVVKFRAANSSNTSGVLASVNVTTDSNGFSQIITVPGLSTGYYDIYIVPNESYLSAKLSNVSFASGQTTNLDFTNGAMMGGNRQLCNTGVRLCAGDIKGLTNATNDEVDLYDYTRMTGLFGQTKVSLSEVLKQADFNNSGDVDIYDWQFTAGNFGVKGADGQ